MPSRIYFASATQLLRCGTNVPSGIYLAPAAPPLRYGANLPFGVYLASAPSPLRHTLIAVVGRSSQPHFRVRRRRLRLEVDPESETRGIVGNRPFCWQTERVMTKRRRRKIDAALKAKIALEACGKRRRQGGGHVPLHSCSRYWYKEG